MKKSAIYCAVLYGVSYPALASAQDVGAPESADATQSGGEIIVTALKRSAALQDVPAAVTALGNDALVNSGVASAEDLATRTPGLEFTAQSNSLQLAIRGLGLDSSNGSGDPTVAPYVNGVFIPRVTAPVVDIADMERVEVLRGPQGTLYGRNSTAGAVNFISLRPTESLEGSGTIGTGSFSRILARGTVAGPLGETFGFRLSGSYDRNDGYIKNLAGNSFLNGDDRLGGQRRAYIHGGLAFQNGSVRNTLDAFYIREANDGPSEILYEQTIPGFFVANYGAEAKSSPTSKSFYSDYGAKTLTKLLLVTNNLEIDLSDAFTLKSITGYSRHDYEGRWDGDGTQLDIIQVGNDRYGAPSNTSDAWSQELNLTGEIGPINFITGAYYFKERSNPSFPLEFTNGLAIFGLPPHSAFVQEAHDRTTTKAVFVDVTLNLSDRLRLVGGVRYNEDRKTLRQTQGAIIPGVPPAFTLACSDTEFKAKYTSTTPRVAVQFDVSPDILTYVQYQKGFKAGAYNLSVCGNKVAPEVINAYEAGMKSSFLSGAAIVNLSAFQYDYTDLQVSIFTTLNGQPTVVLANAADARIKGFELETSLRPSKRWRINLAVTHLNAKYLAYIDPGPNASSPADDISYAGNRLNRAPSWTMMAGFDYEIPVSGFLSSVSIGADLKETGRMFFKPSNRRIESAGPYTMLSAHLNLNSAESGMQLRLVGKNLLNEDIRSGVFESPAQGGVLGYGSLSRTWSLELTKRF